MSLAPGGMVSLFGLDPATYQPSPLHTGERSYIETNCFTDIVIELLHARGDEPVASFGSFVRMGFENDQWTFFKPLAVDLEVLYGMDIHEIQPYRSIPHQIAEVLALGRTMTIELDALVPARHRRDELRPGPRQDRGDRRGDRPGRRALPATSTTPRCMSLEGADFRGAFRTGDGWSGDVLPPYTELIRFDAGPRLEGEELRAAAREILRGHLGRIVPGNPFDEFGARLSAELPALLEGDAARYHAFTFATFRMAGAGFELLASHVEWLLGRAGRSGGGGHGPDRRRLQDARLQACPTPDVRSDRADARPERGLDRSDGIAQRRPGLVRWTRP